MDSPGLGSGLRGCGDRFVPPQRAQLVLARVIRQFKWQTFPCHDHQPARSNEER